MDSAEATAVSQQDEIVMEYEYYNTKTLRPPGEPLEKGAKEMVLTPSKHFYSIPVNTSYSAVHVPTNVYDQGIFMSGTLDSKELPCTSCCFTYTKCHYRQLHMELYDFFLKLWH